MTILVTGGTGQVGSELDIQLKNMNVIYPSRHQLNFEDVDKISDFLEKNKISYVINCAAYTNVNLAEEEIDKANLINAVAVEQLCRACEQTGAYLVHISTDYVFDGLNHRPYTENDRTNPLNVYGKTKLNGEKKIQEIMKNSSIIRTSWVYSSFGNNFLKTMIKLGKEKGELKVVFDQIGTPTYAEDLAIMIATNFSKFKELGGNNLYHFSNEGVASWYDFAHEIFHQTKIPVKLSPCLSSEFLTKANKPLYSVLDKSKIKQVLDITIPHWKEGLEKCLQKMY